MKKTKRFKIMIYLAIIETPTYVLLEKNEALMKLAAGTT